MPGADPLAATFLGDGPSGYGTSTVMGMYLKAWNPTTFECTVSDGAYTYTNCLVLNPGNLVLGRVAVLIPAGGAPLVLGNTYIYIPPPDPEV